MKSLPVRLLSLFVLFLYSSGFADAPGTFFNDLWKAIIHNSSLNDINTRFYPADLKEGLIGFTKGLPVDNPGDNVFQVVLTSVPQEGSHVWLSYELFGVQDHSAVSRSIND